MKNEHLIELINAVSKSELTSFVWEEDGNKISLKKDRVKESENMVVPTPKMHMTIPEPETLSPNLNNKVVKSPLVGTFYVAPSEDAKPFVKAGDSVVKGQVLAIVEAMKLMNEIESEFDGTIGQVLVENGQPVEYGQPLFTVV